MSVMDTRRAGAMFLSLLSVSKAQIWGGFPSQFSANFINFFSQVQLISVQQNLMSHFTHSLIVHCGLMLVSEISENNEKGFPELKLMSSDILTNYHFKTQSSEV